MERGKLNAIVRKRNTWNSLIVWREERIHMGEGTSEALPKETVFELFCAEILHFGKDKGQLLEGILHGTKMRSEV